jgi:hypothetical protein
MLPQGKQHYRRSVRRVRTRSSTPHPIRRVSTCLRPLPVWIAGGLQRRSQLRMLPQGKQHYRRSVLRVRTCSNTPHPIRRVSTCHRPPPVWITEEGCRDVVLENAPLGAARPAKRLACPNVLKRHPAHKARTDLPSDAADVVAEEGFRDEVPEIPPLGETARPAKRLTCPNVLKHAAPDKARIDLPPDAASVDRRRGLQGRSPCKFPLGETARTHKRPRCPNASRTGTG